MTLRLVPLLTVTWCARAAFVDSEILYGFALAAAALLMAWLEHRSAREAREDDRDLLRDVISRVADHGERLARVETKLDEFE